jgi:hypothetical protein
MTDVPTTSPLASLERRDRLGAHAEAIPAFSEGMQRRYAPVLDALVAPVAA